MITIDIRNEVTRDVTRVQDDYEYPDIDIAIWQWTEGNCGCDCNRAMYVERAHGRPDPNHSCGDGLSYRIRIWDADGHLVHAEFGDEP